MSCACAARILQQWRLRLIDVACCAHRPWLPWLPLPHIPCGRPIMQCIGSLGWGLGDGSCTSGGLKLCMQKGPLCSSYCVVLVVMIPTLQHLSSVHSLTPALALQTVVGNLFPVSTNDPSRGWFTRGWSRYTAAGMGCLCVFVSTRLLLHTYAIVGWTSQCNVTPVLVTSPCSG